MAVVIGMTAAPRARIDQHYRTGVVGKWVSVSCAVLAAMLVIACGDTASGRLQNDPPSPLSASASPTTPSTRTHSPTPNPTPSRPPPDGYVFGDYHIKTPLTFCVNPDGGPPLDEPLLLIAQFAVATWQVATGGRLPLEVEGECPGAPVSEVDGLSVIGWEPIPGPAIGLAKPVLDGREGVLEGGIMLDLTDPWMRSSSCVAAVMLHEFGHHLGLGHQTSGPSIMMPNSDCRPLLLTADKEAVRYLYP